MNSIFSYSGSKCISTFNTIPFVRKYCLVKRSDCANFTGLSKTLIIPPMYKYL